MRTGVRQTQASLVLPFHPDAEPSPVTSLSSAVSEWCRLPERDRSDALLFVAQTGEDVELTAQVLGGAEIAALADRLELVG